MSGAQLASAGTQVAAGPMKLILGALRAVQNLLGLVGGLIALLILWEVLVRVTETPTFIFPSASQTIERLQEQIWSYLYEISWTFAAAGIGLVIGSGVGIIGAVLMAQWRVVEKSLFPLAVFLKLVPFIAIAPLLVVWIGYNLWPKIIIAALITFFPVLVNAIAGLRAADPLAVEFFQSVGASKVEIMTRLRWHSSLPYLYAALKLAVNLSLVGAIAGEYYGAEHGIGKVIEETALRLDMRGMFAAILMLAAVGVTLTLITNAIERRALYWHESVRSGAPQ